MSEPVLTSDANVRCMHQGSVEPLDVQQLLVVAGVPVLVKGAFDSASILQCTNVDDPQTGAKQCRHTTGHDAGAATRLVVQGRAVLRASTTGATDGSNPNKTPPETTYSVSSPGQSTLEAE